MFAVVSSGGKQYTVQVGDIIKVEKLEKAVGEKIELPVLLMSDEKGLKTGDKLKKASCQAEVVSQGKEEKVVVFKYKPKKNQRTKQGHRQPYTQLKILSVEG